MIEEASIGGTGIEKKQLREIKDAAFNKVAPLISMISFEFTLEFVFSNSQWKERGRREEKEEEKKGGRKTRK